MIRYHYRAIVACALLLSGALLFAQEKPLVQIDPLTNLSGQPRLDSLCGAIEESIRLTLRLMGRFEIAEHSAAPSSSMNDLDTLHTRAVDRGYDNVIFGSCAIEEGHYIITVSAYDLATNSITYNEKTRIDSLLDTFGAVDEITLAMVEGFSGVRVVFGGLRLLPLERGEPFEFTIDGVSLDSSGGSFERIPSGAHRLGFTQERPLEQFSAELEVDIPESGTVSVVPPIPWFTDSERRIIQAGIDAVQRSIASGEGTEQEQVTSMEELISSPFFSSYRADFRERYDSWRVRAEQPDGSVVETNQPGRLRSLYLPGGFVQIGVTDLPFTETLSTHLSTVEELTRQAVNYVPTRRTITVDGDPGDWTGIPMMADPTGDFDDTVRFYQGGADLTECRFAYDNEYLYFMIRSADSSYRHSKLGHKVHFYNGQAGLYFDYWLAESNPVWVGWDPTSSDARDTEWAAMRSRVKTEYGAVLESAIPIRLLMTWPFFRPVLRLGIATHHDGTSGQPRMDTIESANNLALPIRQILTLSE